LSGRTRLVPLGTNGYFPSGGRQTMSFLLERDGALLLLDAGTGVARLGEPPVAARLARAARLDVVLTHYHVDHVVGLAYLPGVARHCTVTIHAPAPPLVEGAPEALGRLLAPPFFPHPLGEWPMPTEVVPYSGSALEIGPFRLRARAQRHPGGSVGLRVDDALAYVTDTSVDPETELFVAGVDLLLHEAWLTNEEAEREDAARSGHSAVGPVADLARRAGVGRLALVHHRPGRDGVALAALRAEAELRSGLPVLPLVEGEAVDVG